MKVYDRHTREYQEIRQYGQEKLQFLYGNPFGRLLLKLVISPVTSRIYGWYNRRPKSAEKIPNFIRENGIRMEDFEEREYESFADFFTRKLKPGARQINMNENALISPADAKLLVYEISDGMRVRVKGSEYTLEELLGCGSAVAGRRNVTGGRAALRRGKDASGGRAALRRRMNPEDFEGGVCLVFRLCMDDYHRYCYIDRGRLKRRYHIGGKLHTVSSISKDYKIYKENSRVVNEYQTEHFGRVIQIEVGALLVGRIRNRNVRTFEKGEEKGYFEPGGSTIIVLLQKGAADIDEDICRMSAGQIETIVKYGEKVGERRRDYV